MKITTFSGVIGSGPPDSWSGGAKEAVRQFATKRQAEAAYGKRIRHLVAKGYGELRPPRRASGRVQDSARDAWARVEGWFYHQAPADSEFPLAAGSAAEDLAKLEEQIGQRLPSDFRAAYKRHNGSNRTNIFGILAIGYWMPLFRPSQLKGLFRSVSDQWQSMTDMLRNGAFDELGSSDRPKGPIRAQHWNPGWVPFTCDDSGDFLCVDLDPPTGGKRGQVIFWWHEYGPYTVVADSFQDLLCRLADKLEAGVYAFSVSEGHGEELYCTLPVKRNFDALLKMFKRE